MPDSDSAIADAPLRGELDATADLAVAIDGADGECALQIAASLAADIASGVLTAARAVLLVTTEAAGTDAANNRVRAASGPVSLRELGVPPESGARDGTRGLAERPHALRAVLVAARDAGARAIAVVDSSRAADAAAYASRMAAPVLRGDADFVVPQYARRRFTGAFTSGVVYPLTRALYGRRVRHPVLTEFACSADLTAMLLNRGSWPAELGRLGSDCWVLTHALCSPFRVAQAHVPGVPPVGAGGGNQLSDLQARVLAPIFTEAERHAATWQRVRGSKAVPAFGSPDEDADEPAADPLQALDAFRLAQRNLADVWSLILTPASLLELRRITQRPDADITFGDDLWARITYDFVLAHRFRTMSRDHLFSAFTPLYLGWFGAFVLGMRDAADDAVEARIEGLCTRFEEQKPYVISRWRSPDRFNP